MRFRRRGVFPALLFCLLCAGHAHVRIRRYYFSRRPGNEGREAYPDEELRRRIMDFIMAAGQTLLENGAEVFRVEQTMEIMARSFHLREFHVYVLTNGIFASAGTAEISEVRNVPVRTTHLGRVRR